MLSSTFGHWDSFFSHPKNSPSNCIIDTMNRIIKISINKIIITEGRNVGPVCILKKNPFCIIQISVCNRTIHSNRNHIMIIAPCMVQHFPTSLVCKGEAKLKSICDSPALWILYLKPLYLKYPEYVQSSYLWGHY